MDIERLEFVRAEAVSLMRTFGLYEDKWTFRYNRSICTMGRCFPPEFPGGQGRIELSCWYVDLNPDEHVLDTIKHEIAHALCGHTLHNDIWKAVCRIIGATPEAAGPAKMPSREDTPRKRRRRRRTRTPDVEVVLPRSGRHGPIGTEECDHCPGHAILTCLGCGARLCSHHKVCPECDDAPVENWCDE